MKKELSFSIRPAKIDDFEELSRLYEEGDSLHRDNLPGVFRQVPIPARSKEMISSILADDNASLFVAESGDELIGLLCIYIQKSRAISFMVSRLFGVIDDLVVKNGYRRQGLGRALMQEAERWLNGKGVNQIELNVWDFNKTAIDFYRKLHYDIASHRMWKSLPGK